MPPPEQAPPQQGQQPTYEQIAAAIAAGAAASAAPTAAPGAAGAATGALSAAAVAQTTKTVIEKMLDLARTRWNVMFDPSGPVAETVKDEYPSRDTTDVMDLVDQREREFEREFRRKMRRRLEADIPEALAEPDPKKREQRLANIFKREMRYTAMREEAILSRAMGALEADMLQTLSPKGAYWKLSPHVKEHTLDCLAMGEKFWPWSVLRKVQPPLHYGCPCYLLGLDEVVEMGLMTAEQVPDEADARARYGRIAEKIDDLRDLDEAAIEELYAVALENLEEARVRRPLRWAKGLVKGGQFRPMRGGTPGRRVALPLPESPTKQRGAERGRWTWVGGAYTKIPEADAWTRNRNGKTYHSPPGGTNLYADGVLINEPGQVSPPGERVKAPVGTPAGIPAELAAKIDSARSMFRREAHSGRGIPPIAVGDGPSAVLNLRDAGYTADEATLVGPKQRGLRFKASEGTLLVELGSVGAVQNVRWEPARKNRQRETLTRPAETWDEHTGDALGFADELGEKYSTKVKAPTMFADDSLGDHAGTHLWTGEIKVGREAPVDVERAGLKRAAGEPLSEDEKRGVYATYWVTMHELTHSVNPIAPMDFNGPNASLEEAIAEEMGHKLALDRLAAHGQYDVIEWRFANPDALAVRGVYPNERYALQTILDEAKVPEADRAEVIQRMAFQMRPDARLSYLATLHAGENGGDVNESRARIETLLDEKTMRRAPTSFRSIINPKSVRPKTVGQYGTWSNEDGTPGDWTPDEDALNKWTAEIQVGPHVTLAGDGVPVVKYSDGTVGVGTPHGSSTDELTLTPNAAAAAQVALLRSDYAAVYATDYKATGRREQGDAGLSPAQVASQRAMAALMDSPESPGVKVDPTYEKVARKARANYKKKAGSLNPYYLFGHATAKDAKHVGNLIAEARLAVRITPRGLSGFLKNGVMLNSMDRGQRPSWRVESVKEYGKTAKDDNYLEKRRLMEEALFGATPIYGYFRSRDAGSKSAQDNETFFYGNVIVELDPQVKDRTTWTVGDSLNYSEPRPSHWGGGKEYEPRMGGVIPSPVGESSALSVGILGPYAPTDYSLLGSIDELFDSRPPVVTNWAGKDLDGNDDRRVFENDGYVMADYTEAQIFGSRPSLQEVTRVVFQAPERPKERFGKTVKEFGPNASQAKALDRAGIPWELQTWDGKVVKRGKAEYVEPDQTVWERTDETPWTGANQPKTLPKVGAKVKEDQIVGAPIGSRIKFIGQDGKPVEAERRNYGWFVVDKNKPVTFQDVSEDLLDEQTRGFTDAEMARTISRVGKGFATLTIGKEDAEKNKYGWRSSDWIEVETDIPPEWSALPPQSPGTLPDPPQSPGWGWFSGEKEEKSAWLPKKGAKKPKPAKPKPPKVIGGKKNVPEDNGTPFPDYDGQKLTISGRAGGSNGAEWALDENGDRWLVKTYRGDEDRIATELVANRIYALMGAKVARAGMIEVDGKTGLTYKALDGKPRDRVFHKEGPNAKMGEHYMTDALLANWDFAGLTDDNVLWGEDGNPIRVDQGGTLEFRAMGQQKPFGPVPTDVWTMLRKGQGKRASLVTEDQMREQADAIAETLTPEVIDELMNTAPFVDAEMRERVRENLKARVDWMGAFADGDVNIPQIPEGESARQEFDATQDGFELYPEEISALSFYSLGGAMPVQKHLRSKAPDEGADPKVLGAVDALDAILKDAKTREDLFVYVPMDKPVGDDAKLVGRTVEERGFIHATTDKATAAEDGGMVRLLVPAGSHAVRLRGLDPTLPDGPEVVIRRDSRMKITSVRDDDGAEVWEATLLPPARRGFGFSGPYKPSGGASKGKKPSSGQMGLLDAPEDFPEPPMSPGTNVALDPVIPPPPLTEAEKREIIDLPMDDKIAAMEELALPGGEIYTVGGCEKLALALKLARPDFKIAMLNGGAHVAAYDPKTGIAYDASGAKWLDDVFVYYASDLDQLAQDPDGPDGNGLGVAYDVDPEELANGNYGLEINDEVAKDGKPWSLDEPFGGLASTGSDQAGMEIYSAGDWAHRVGLAGLEWDEYWHVPLDPTLPAPPQSPGTRLITTLDVDGEQQPVDYAEISGLPTTTRVYAAFVKGVRPDDDREWGLPGAPVAFLTVDPEKNTLELAYTDERFRRRGLADSLVQVARRDTGLALNTDTGERSPMGREWAAAAGIGTSPKGGQLGRDLTQEEADKLGARMLTDIGDRVQWAAAMSGPSFLNRGEPIPMSETIREVDPEDFPEPPMSPGTASDRAAALTMPDEEARALLAENGMNAAKPDPKKAVREADPAFLGTLAYLSTLYPQAADYVSEVAFASSKTLGESPVEGGPRSGKVSGQIRRSARAANWGAQVRWTTDWNDPNGDFDSNFRGKLIYNDYRGDDADYLRQMDDGAIITLPRTDGSKLRLQHYRWESGLAEAIGIPAEGWVEEGQTPQAARRVPYGIRTSKEVQNIWRTENAHTISDTYPDATPNNEAAQAAHEFGHAIAGGLRSPEFTALLTEANDNLKENPRTADAIPLAAYVDKYLASASEAGTDAPLAWLWTLTDRIARQTKTGDLGWRVFIDRGISMGEIRSVSPYAATEPAEALAELFSAHYLGLLDDELDAKFEAMLADLTQTDLPEPPMSPGTAPAPAEMMAAVEEVGVEVEAPGLSPFDRYDIGTLFPDLRHSTFQTQPEETIAYYRDMAPAVAAMNEQYPDVMESLTSVAWLSSRDVGWSSEWAELATQAFPDEPVSNLRRWGNEEIRRNLSKARASFTYAGRAQQLGRQASGKIILNDLTIDYQKPPGEHLAPATKTAYGTFLHEFGHAVAHKYNFQERLSLAGAFGFANEDDYFDWDAWYQEGGEWLGWDLLAEYFDISAVMEVSAYAASNPNEAFAEMFAMYYHPDFDLPPALKANFEDFLAAMRRGDRRTNSGPVEPQSQDVLRARFEQEVQLSIARDEAGLDPSDFGDFGPYLDSQEQSG